VNEWEQVVSCRQDGHCSRTRPPHHHQSEGSVRLVQLCSSCWRRAMGVGVGVGWCVCRGGVAVQLLLQTSALASNA